MEGIIHLSRLTVRLLGIEHSPMQALALVEVAIMDRISLRSGMSQAEYFLHLALASLSDQCPRIALSVPTPGRTAKTD